MSPTPDGHGRHRLARAALATAGAIAGLVVAVIVTLNLHIFLGVQAGYMATPTQVIDRSVWILVVDALILIALPTAAATLVLRIRRPRHEPDHSATPPPDRPSTPRHDHTTDQPPKP